MQIILDIDDMTAPLLATLDDEGSAEGAIYRLIDHACQRSLPPRLVGKALAVLGFR
jgi:hypothetical protein